jgi:hypothetical protein
VFFFVFFLSYGNNLAACSENNTADTIDAVNMIRCLLPANNIVVSSPFHLPYFYTLSRKYEITVAKLINSQIQYRQPGGGTGPV